MVRFKHLVCGGRWIDGLLPPGGLPPPGLTRGVPQVGGAAVMAVGVWTLVEKSGHLSVLASSTFVASAYILILAGALVVVTGFLGFGAIVREQKSCLSTVSAHLSWGQGPALPLSPVGFPVE